MNRQLAIGAVLMVAGIALFIPVLGPGVTGLANLLLVPAAAMLVYGTYLVGTSQAGGDDDGSVV